MTLLTYWQKRGWAVREALRDSVSDSEGESPEEMLTASEKEELLHQSEVGMLQEVASVRNALAHRTLGSASVLVAPVLLEYTEW